MKYLVCFVAGAMVTALVLQLRPSDSITSLPVQTKEKFQQLGTEEARAFAEAQDAESKLKAADALYGKMMVLFLAELGLKLKPNNAVAVVPAELENVKASAESEKSSQVIVTPSSQALTCPPCASAMVENHNQKKMDLAREYKVTGYATKLDETVKRIMGKYQGALIHKRKRYLGRIDSVQMSFELEQSGKMLKGHTTVILTDPDGKAYSRSRGNGGNKAIKVNGDLVFIEVSPDSYFVIPTQAFKQDTLKGDYFLEDKNVGMVVLDKL